MFRPWPEGEEAVVLLVEELALRLLDRMATAPDDPSHSLFRRDLFIERELIEHELHRRQQSGATTVTHSAEALDLHPELAGAWSEAWDYAVRRRWIGDDVTRCGFVRVTKVGQERLARYRAGDASVMAEEAQPGPGLKPIPGPQETERLEQAPSVAGGEEGDPMDAAAEMPDQSSRLTRVRTRWSHLRPAIRHLIAALALVAWVATIYDVFVRNDGQPELATPVTPSDSTDLSPIIQAAKRNGFNLAEEPREIAFRAAEAPSILIHFRSQGSTSQVSDEIQIYEISSGQRPKLKFRYRPVGPRQQTVERELGTEDARVVGRGEPRSFVMAIRLARDLDGVPGSEVIVDLSEFDVKPVWPRPAYLYWDAAAARYKIQALLSPLTTKRTTMEAVITREYLRTRDRYARYLIERVYMRPTTISNAAGATPVIRPYAVEEYVVKRERIDDPRGPTYGGIALTAGYVVKGSSYGKPDLLQAVTWHIDLRTAPIQARASTSRPRVIPVGAHTGRLRALLARSP